MSAPARPNGGGQGWRGRAASSWRRWSGRLEAAGDTRLVGPALLGWASCWWAVAGAPWRGAAVGAPAVVGAAVAVRRGRWGAVATLGVAACTAASAAVASAAAAAGPLPQLAAEQGEATATVVLTRDPHVSAAVPSRPDGAPGSRVVAPARAEEVHGAGRTWRVHTDVVVLASGGRWLDLLPGQRLLVHARLDTGRGGTPLLLTRGPPHLLGPPPWWQRAAGAVRGALARAVVGEQPDVRGLLPSMVVNDRRLMPRQLSEDAERTGLPHVVAVSGFSLLVVVSAALGLARALRLHAPVQAALGAAVLVAEVVLVRPEPRILRAAAMACTALLAIAVRRRRAALPALCASATGLLLWQPALSRSPGFALSVAGTLGLVVWGPPISDHLRRKGWPRWLADALAMPVAAHLATAPLVAAVRGELSVVTAPANALAEPAVPLVLLLGLPAAVLASLGLGAPAAAMLWLARWPALWVAAVAHRGAHLPAAVVGVPDGAAGVAVTAALLALVVVLLRRPTGRRVAVAAVVGLAAANVTVRHVVPAWPPPGWALVVCDVGQGDGLVLSTTPGHAVVVDAGPDPVPERRCLDRLDVRVVDLLVLTHTHADHFGGLDGVLQGRRVLAAWAGPLPEPAAVWRAGTTTLAAVGVRPVVPPPGSWAQLGALRLQVLAPGHAFAGTRSDPNNSSLVLRATRPGLSALLTGDVEREAQRELLDRTDVRADVLKIPHHGSRFQLPALLDAVGARIAVASAGSGNSYGHPDPGTLRRLRDGGAVVLRTDRDGSVAVVPGPGGPRAYPAGDPLPPPAALGGPRLAALCDPRAVRGPPLPRPPRAVAGGAVVWRPGLG